MRVGIASVFGFLLVAATVFAIDSPSTCMAAEGDWPVWRGPTGNNIAPGPPVPTEWDETKNVVWRIPLEGRGHCSPIIVGDRIYLTSADQESQVASVFAFDKQTGKQVWRTPVTRGGFQTDVHTKNTHATPTLASNGQQLFAVFVQNQQVQLTALDRAGKIEWQIDAGPYVPEQYKFGYAPSPMLYDDLVIVASEFEKGWLAAFSQHDGQQRWRVSRMGSSYSTPIVAHLAGRDQMLLSGHEKVASFDPQTGKLLWEVDGTNQATCGTIVWEGDMIYASGGYPASPTQTIAVKVGESPEVAWTCREQCYEQSMLVSNGYLYAINDRGVFFCWNAKTGEEMWKKRLGSPVSSSPLLSGDNIFIADEKGNMYVLKANPQQYEFVAKNQLGDETFASPIASEGRLYARYADSSQGSRQEYLICIGQQ
ncbi:dehydrogenase [Blastopirellula marina]|uniref:Dehydrogenase n=2 Tax=Blastopirellula marina TaxID=124 RepID=A0A2S8FWW3_9BACT|nr:dehydrogenase [Blastopirellula marina]PTL44495.1 dehydrogenase [Blastopirellula marina]